MDHQFLNVDCHPSALPRPALHPSYVGSSGGGYSLDVHQSSDSLANQFNPFRLPTSSDTSSQFSAFDSFYKAYQSAYGQNSALGVMFGHPSYRFDGPMLPHDQQLMLPSGFLQYPPIFPNSSLYAALPGSSTNQRYPGDYFGQNLSGLSSFSNSSKFASGPDLSSTQSWLGIDRPSNLLNAFTSPPTSSDSSKEDRHGNDSSTKKVGEGDHYETRSAFANHPAHQPCTSSQIKFNRQADDPSNSLRHHFSSSNSSLQSSLLDPFNHQRRGNGEVLFPSKRNEYPFPNERSDDKKSEFPGHNSSKDSSLQKRGIPASLSKSTSFPVVTTFQDVSCIGEIHPPMSGNFARHSNEYLFSHYASKMYPPNSFSSELINLQSKTAPSSTFHHHQQNASFLQRSNDKARHEAKVIKSEDKNSSKNCLPSSAGSKQVHHVEKSFEQKFHRPFELAPGKSVMENSRGNNSTPQKAKKGIGKNMLGNERALNSLKNVHQQNSHVSSHSSKTDPVFHNLSADGSVSASELPANPAKDKSSHDSCYYVKDSKLGDETPLNLAFGDGRTDKRMKSPLVSKLDLEEAWRSTYKNGRIQGEGRSQTDLKYPEMKYEDLYDDYEYEYDKKMARLTTILFTTPLHPSNNSQEKIDFLSNLGLSTKEKCKELEYEKHGRRKRQLRERSISPTILKDDEEHMAEGGITCCTSDCPHKNGLNKEAMLAMLGLHQIEICSEKGKYYEGVDLCAMTTDTSSVLPSFTSSYSHSFSYSPSLSTSFYSFPTQYPTPHLPTSPYTFYPPGYLIDQPSSSAVPSSSSLSLACTPAVQLPLATPYCNFYDNHNQVSDSKTSLTDSYHSNFTNCFDGQQLYYAQGKTAKEVPTSSVHDGSSYVGYNINNSFENQNLLDSPANMSSIMMERCISSTPACRNPRAKDPSLLENGLPNDKKPSPFNWPGVESVIESYHRYVEERAMEKQLLLEHSTKLSNSNAEMLDTYEQLKNSISNLRKVQLRQEEEKSLTQSQLDILKDFMMQLK